MRIPNPIAWIICYLNSRSFRLPAATAFALSVLAAARAQAPATQEAVQAPLLVVRIADEQDKPIAGAELYLVRNDNIQLSRTWIAAVDGRAEIKAIDLIGDPRQPFTGKVRAVVRAPGYAPSVQLVELPRTEPLTVRQPRGKRVELRLKAPQGVNIPETLTPISYFTNDAMCAWMSVRGWQRGDDMHYLFNATPMESLGTGRFAFQVSESCPDFFVMVSHPGFLRAFQAGPFGKDDVARGTIDVELPKPGTVHATFGGEGGADVKPGDASLGLGLGVYGYVDREDRAYFPLGADAEKGHSIRRDWADLAPGTYMVEAFEGDLDSRNRRGDGRFRQNRLVEIAAGDEKSVAVTFTPFDEAAAREKMRGEYAADITVRNLDGSPAADQPYKLTFHDGRYSASLVLAEGRTDAQGRMTVRGLAGGEQAVAAELTINDQELGQVQLDGDQKQRKLDFQMPPRAGDPAPELVLQDVAGGERHKLSEFRGQIVFVDFWATWCGPCQAPMQHNSEVLSRRAKDWQGKATILAASIDDKPELVEKHCKTRGWNNVRQTWCCAGAPGWGCDAVKSYVIRGVPTALLIDGGGKIVWRGHPGTVDVEVEIDKLLAKAPASKGGP